ncbi:MAG: 2OG-Fe(II) oxygenase [Gammaproteobacteria bacterium]
MISDLVRGDRVPDFQRPGLDDKPVLLYDLQIGRPLLLLIVENPGAPGARAIFAALNDSAALEAAHCLRVVLLRARPEDCHAFAGGQATRVTLLADDGTVIRTLLGPASGARSAVTALALDANMRILERLEPAPDEDPEAFLGRLAAVYEQQVAPPAQIRSQQAPLLFIPRVFEPALCAELIDYFTQEGGKPSGTGIVDHGKIYWKLDPAVKMRTDVYLQAPVLLERVKELLVRRVLPEIKRCFNYQVTQHEVFKLACYDAGTGGYFRPHRDNETPDTRHRRFAMTLNLNTGDYSGGQLRLPEFGPDLYQPGRGDAVIFSSSLLHEVVPVTAGKRYVLIGFFFGDEQHVAKFETVARG